MLALAPAPAFAAPNGLGLTPPMGWNPYNHMKSSGFKWNVDEQTLYDSEARPTCRPPPR